MSTTLWALIALQIAMGGFDTFYHHEMTERLAWRASQRRELVLHGIRNLFYALLFALFGWSEVHGVWAMIVIGLLLAEAIITLMDFVEEDRSRALPATERVTHTLLALNYGAILALLLPVLWAWSREPAEIAFAQYGIFSFLASAAALGTAICGPRDLFAARRIARLVRNPAAAIAPPLANRKTLLVTGATGFVGRRLCEVLTAYGHDVIALVRDPRKASLFRPPFTLITDLDQVADETRIDAVVNLAGEPIANGLWTKAKRGKILRSRLDMTADVVRLIARLDHRPEVLVSASAKGWYGLYDDEVLDETSEGRGGFGHEVCDAWEHAARQAEPLGVRVVLLRIALVLGSQGGMLGRLLPVFEWGLGGPIGSGKQWTAWIEHDDLVRLILHVIATPDMTGPVNATSPHPVRNAEFTSALAHALHRPAIFRIPAWPLRLVARDFADELLLGGQRVMPEKALASGFVFHHPSIDDAFRAILGKAAQIRRQGLTARQSGTKTAFG
jgi:uncharacterized protein (TIGR01777 family)